MKKNALVLALSVTLGGLVSVSAFATIAPGTTVPGGNINFTGEVTSETCKIENDTPNGAIDKAVLLDNVSASELIFAGTTAKPKPFTITLGGDGDTNCINGSVASVYFEPTSPAITDAGWLENTDKSDDGAKNVQVQILNGDTLQPINLKNGTNNVEKKTIGDNTAVFSYIGQYISVEGKATPGNVASTVKYSIVYQ